MPQNTPADCWMYNVTVCCLLMVMLLVCLLLLHFLSACRTEYLWDRQITISGEILNLLKPRQIYKVRLRISIEH